MYGEKSAPVREATRAEAIGGKFDGVQMSIPEFDFTTTTRSGSSIESLLQRGFENAISTSTLVEMTGVGTARQLQKQIEHERLHGAVILSDSTGGYFLPSHGIKGRLEVDSFCRTVTARANNSLCMVRAVEEAARHEW